MNNQDIPVLFLARRVPSASNGRGNFKFKNGILYSYDNVIAVFSGDELLVNADTFSATSSRHQSAIKCAADGQGDVGFFRTPWFFPDGLTSVFSGGVSVFSGGVLRCGEVMLRCGMGAADSA